MSLGPHDVVVDHSAAWVHVSFDDDIAAWAPSAARRLWSASGQPFSAWDVHVLGAQLAAVGRSAFAVPCPMALVFCPELSGGPRAVFRLSDAPYPPGAADEQILDDILLPVERQLLPPQVRHSDGPGSRHLRVRQRAWSEGTRAVYDHITYVFPFEEGAWALSTCLADPGEAERWLPDFDELAAGVRLQEAS